jgi:putative nucleotidyltransferase with HDIG domain
MLLHKPTNRSIWVSAEILIVGGTVSAAIALASPVEWRPASLVAILLGLSLISEWFTVNTRFGVVNASLAAMVLAMGLLGPSAAVACGLLAISTHGILRRRTPVQWLGNLCLYSLPPFAGGWLVRVLAGNPSGVHTERLAQSFVFGLIVLGALGVLSLVNLVIYGFDMQTRDGTTLRRVVRDAFLPILPGEMAVGTIATVIVLLYRSAGVAALFASIPVLLIFRQLMVALLRSEDRADQLEARTIHLTSLQQGLLETLVKALGMRDESSGRHSADVALHALALAKEFGADEDTQDAVHKAALLHDIGKFTWPDRLFLAEGIEPRDEETIRRHPEVGAELVGRLDGYGPVAEIILHQRERVDGSGYPARLIAGEIPLGSRILAICCVYDTMTRHAHYRPAMTPGEATNELKIAAERGQLDGELVDMFLDMIEREAAQAGVPAQAITARQLPASITVQRQRRQPHG